VTVAPVMNPVPVIVTEVPPPVGPEVGLSDVTAGVTVVYVNWSATTICEVPPVVVTRTLAIPVVTVAGDVAVMVVEFTTVTPVAVVAPYTTVAPVLKLVPVIVTAVPPVAVAV